MASRTAARQPVNPLKSFFVGSEPMTNGLWGMVFFIFSEIMFFTGLIAAYLALREDALEWAPLIDGVYDHGAGLEVGFRPIFFTILLVSSSIPMQAAAFAIRKGNRGAMKAGMVIVMLIGAAFLLNQAVEWMGAEFAIGDGPYSATFYLLTGFHGAHVLGGLLFITFLWMRSQLGHFDAHRNTAVEAATMYWHFVGAVWILVFSLLFLA